MKRLFPFLQLHSAFPVDSLRVRWVPLFPSFQRLGAFAISPRPGVRGFRGSLKLDYPRLHGMLQITPGWRYLYGAY